MLFRFWLSTADFGEMSLFVTIMALRVLETTGVRAQANRLFELLFFSCIIHDIIRKADQSALYEWPAKPSSEVLKRVLNREVF